MKFRVVSKDQFHPGLIAELVILLNLSQCYYIIRSLDNIPVEHKLRRKMQINNTAFCALRWPIYPCVLSLFIFLFICTFISHLHKKTFWDKVCLKNFSQASVIKFIHAMLYPQGGTPYFKWRGWPNGDKNQNPKKSLGLPTQKNVCIKNQLQKNPVPNFLPLKNFRRH